MLGHLLRRCANIQTTLVRCPILHEYVRSRATGVIQDNAETNFINDISMVTGFNPLTAKLFNYNFHPLEVVSR